MAGLFQRGRTEGWLCLPVTTLPDWMRLFNVELHGVKIGRPLDRDGRGLGLIAEQLMPKEPHAPLMKVPQDLMLSLDGVKRLAHSDPHLKEVLEATDNSSNTARGAIMIFLLLQLTMADPAQKEAIGVAGPFSGYTRFLPNVDALLPTCWTQEEIDLFSGTSLKPAVEAKLSSLRKEFDRFAAATETISWCRKVWWDASEGELSFGDWRNLDALYRSRGLDFPGVGSAMIPCMDMANHASGINSSARFETDFEGNALLLRCDDREIPADHEITISYGDEKGACEMLFSYGFIEEDMATAKSIFLDLSVPVDDPLGRAKTSFWPLAPGVRIDSEADHLKWDSEFVWLFCVNEEDGLDFRIEQAIDGQRVMKAFWRESELSPDVPLRTFLKQEASYNLYRLRAICMIQERVASQLQQLYGAAQTVERAHVDSQRIHDKQLHFARRLIELEGELLEEMNNTLAQEQNYLMETEVVREYLQEVQGQPSDEIDFS